MTKILNNEDIIDSMYEFYIYEMRMLSACSFKTINEQEITHDSDCYRCKNL